MSTAPAIVEDTASPLKPVIANGIKSRPAIKTPDHGPDGTSPSKSEQIKQRYAEERNKRLRSDGPAQYIDLTITENKGLRRFIQDHWDDGATSPLTLEEDAHFKVVIMGAGFGGLVFAARLLNAGFRPENIVIVDVAAGFGGTWYWNRYPGLMCDVESYIYMPFLEETGYMPKHKYSYGQELREHANRIAKQWSLEDRAMFRTKMQRCYWNDDDAEWAVEMTQQLPSGQIVSANVRADFVIFAPGVLHRPKITDLPGLETFQGQSFHTARWDYKATGGGQESPHLSNLQGKRVGIIGTGATAVQVVPHLAKWSKQLYVFQRTPASVDIRDQRATDPKQWVEEIANEPGWQLARSRNFISFTANRKPSPPVDMVSDGWTKFPSFSAATGGENPVSVEAVAEHVERMHELDLPRSERVRARVDEIVKDKEIAQKLKHWYSGWCKRPTFHDDYLPTFNLPHVTLVDTNGKGVQNITESGLTVNGEDFDLDVLVFSTGFQIISTASPGSRSGVQVFGRGGKSMDEKWTQGISTLHGAASNEFPNMFFSGVNQSGAAPNYMMSLDAVAQNVAFIMSEGLKRVSGSIDGKVTIEPTREAEAAWSTRIRDGAPAFAAVVGCTPSYFNAEGSRVRVEDQPKATASGPWPSGMNKFMDVLQNWRDTGDLNGLEISLARPSSQQHKSTKQARFCNIL